MIAQPKIMIDNTGRHVATGRIGRRESAAVIMLGVLQLIVMAVGSLALDLDLALRYWPRNPGDHGHVG